MTDREKWIVYNMDKTINNRNSRKRRRDKIDFRYTVLLDKKTYNKLKTEKQ